MKRSSHLLSASLVLPVILLLTAISFAQQRNLPEEDFYGDIKKALASHYNGKIVKAKLPIPATRRGLEILDGTLQNSAEPNSPPPIAQPGDELVIKSIRVTDSDIEFLLTKTEQPPKKRFSNPFTVTKVPRINLRLSRELNTQDLTIENINRLLASVVDTSTLATPVSDKNSNLTQASVNSSNGEQVNNDQNLPTPNIVGDLPSLPPSMAELTVDCSVREARVYLNGSFSGLTPRTVRLRAGVHTILIVSDGYMSWEQKLFVPGGKASVVRAELQRHGN